MRVPSSRAMHILSFFVPLPLQIATPNSGNPEPHPNQPRGLFRGPAECFSLQVSVMAATATASQIGGILTGYPNPFTFTPNQDRSEAAAFRARVRNAEVKGHTSGHAPNFVQANFVALPKEYAFEFLVFCLRNPRACPLLEVTDAGVPTPFRVAPDADLRTDIPRYRVYVNGKVEREVEDATSLWTDDTVGFLLGCSFSWEGELAAAGLCPRHVEEGKNVSMYKTNIANVASGRFKGTLVVSMRPYLPEHIDKVRAITSRYAGAHGGPVHVGSPTEIGIEPERLSSPDYGDAVTLREGEVPVFWACGVTPQTAIADAGIPLALTHAPGCMFITDILTSEMAPPAAPQ